MEEAESDSKI